MTEKERGKIYTKVFNFLITHNIREIPTNMEKICSILNVSLVPLSDIVKSTGLPAPQIFEIWGNEDGAATVYCNAAGEKSFKIAYNNYRLRRTRFTIAEELGHIILGHLQDEDFRIFSQTYSDETYARYDEEARIVAGILICPPNFYYENEKNLDEQTLSKFCNISQPCAQARIRILDKYRKEINMHPLYAKLPEILLPNC